MDNPNDWNKTIIEEFRANGGQVGGYFANVTVLLLHTTGARTHHPRINPLVYLRAGDRFVIAASKRGAPANPDWYYNLLAQPLVTVEVGTEKFQARAAPATEPERTRLYDQMAATMPNYAEYQRSTTRVIPVIILTRIS
jgi:deazaflavin-dependent oxidoreductase (nitroreductase family)